MFSKWALAPEEDLYAAGIGLPRYTWIACDSVTFVSAFVSLFVSSLSVGLFMCVCIDIYIHIYVCVFIYIYVYICLSV